MTTILQVPTAPLLGDGELDQVLAGLLPSLLLRRGDMLAVKDVASGRYVHANEAMAGFLQRPLAALLGCGDVILSHREWSVLGLDSPRQCRRGDGA